jgi:hypothetical protein
VNYAFSFLDVAGRAAEELASVGVLESVEVRSTFELPGPVLPIEVMFTEVAVHPWSWVLSLLGSSGGIAVPDGSGWPDAGCEVRSHESHRLLLQTSAAGVRVSVECRRVAGRQGITHEVLFRGARGQLSVRGDYNIGSEWSFPPPQVHWADGRTDVLGSDEAGLPDPWYRANARAVAAVVSTVGGGPADARLFTWNAALGLDRCVQSGLGRTS